jgi:hypothetical protein
VHPGQPYEIPVEGREGHGGNLPDEQTGRFGFGRRLRNVHSPERFGGKA